VTTAAAALREAVLAELGTTAAGPGGAGRAADALRDLVRR
jgi:hypothetical protein